MTALRHQLFARSTWLLLFEVLLIYGAVALGTYVQLGPDAWSTLSSRGGAGKALLVVAVCVASLYYWNLYELRALKDWREVLARIMRAVAVAVLTLAALYLWFPGLILDGGVVLSASGLVVASAAGSRVAFDSISRHAVPRERILIVGATQAAIGLARELRQEGIASGVEVVGFIQVGAESAGSRTVETTDTLGTLDDIPSIVRARNVDRVVVSLANLRGQLPIDKLLQLKMRHGIRFDHLSDAYEMYTGKIAVENLRPSWLIFSDGFRTTRGSKAIKRTCDIGLAAMGLVISIPLMMILALLVKLTSPGPVLYCQQRVGQFGRVFTIRKLRSMRADAEARTGAVWAKADDDRVTPIGRFLRRARLDELPQLWNVIVGEMSLVGPRPERPEFVQMLTEQIPFYGKRHVIRPGLTGWAQVRYTYGATVEDALEKLQYDLYYLKHMTVTFDLMILFETVKVILQRRGAV